MRSEPPAGRVARPPEVWVLRLVTNSLLPRYFDRFSRSCCGQDGMGLACLSGSAIPGPRGFRQLFLDRRGDPVLLLEPSGDQLAKGQLGSRLPGAAWKGPDGIPGRRSSAAGPPPAYNRRST